MKCWSFMKSCKTVNLRALLVKYYSSTNKCTNVHLLVDILIIKICLLAGVLIVRVCMYIITLYTWFGGMGTCQLYIMSVQDIPVLVPVDAITSFSRLYYTCGHVCSFLWYILCFLWCEFIHFFTSSPLYPLHCDHINKGQWCQEDHPVCQVGVLKYFMSVEIQCKICLENVCNTSH
jgi:hypothetical protein